MFSIVPYLRVFIVLCPSHSILEVYVGKLEVYVGKYLYVVYPNNKIHEIK